MTKGVKFGHSGLYCLMTNCKDYLYRVAMVLENPGKSWNWQKKIPSPGKFLNLGCSP